MSESNQEERGITGQCSKCGVRVPRSELRNGMCPPCARSTSR